MNSPDGLSMIGVTAGGQVIHTSRKTSANYSIRVSAKMNSGSSCDLEKMEDDEETKKAVHCKNVSQKNNPCKCKLSVNN